MPQTVPVSPDTVNATDNFRVTVNATVSPDTVNATVNANVIDKLLRGLNDQSIGH